MKVADLCHLVRAKNAARPAGHQIWTATACCTRQPWRPRLAWSAVGACGCRTAIAGSKANGSSAANANSAANGNADDCNRGIGCTGLRRVNRVVHPEARLHVARRHSRRRKTLGDSSCRISRDSPAPGGCQQYTTSSPHRRPDIFSNHHDMSPMEQ